MCAHKERAHVLVHIARSRSPVQFAAAVAPGLVVLNPSGHVVQLAIEPPKEYVLPVHWSQAAPP
jgi:hypothetical protein